MPEQQVAGPGEHAHTLEARGLAYVARAAVCRMQPQHIGLGAQAQVVDNCVMGLGFAVCLLAGFAGHGCTPSCAPRSAMPVNMSRVPSSGVVTAVRSVLFSCWAR